MTNLTHQEHTEKVELENFSGSPYEHIKEEEEDSKWELNIILFFS
jgi:hypothetical protein